MEIERLRPAPVEVYKTQGFQLFVLKVNPIYIQAPNLISIQRLTIKQTRSDLSFHH